MIRTACLLSLACFLSASIHAAPITYAIATDKTAIGLSWRAFTSSSVSQRSSSKKWIAWSRICPPDACRYASGGISEERQTI